jgi:hypothetical protein
MKSEELYKNISASSSRMSGEVARCIPGDIEKPAGITLIAEERNRQITQEGFDAEHDRRIDSGDLSFAAISYTRVARTQLTWGNTFTDFKIPEVWPFHPVWWKPSGDPIRNLVKAGALIAAEIDRLQNEGGEK